MKICNKCNIEKELSEFYKDLSRVDGKTYQCKGCIKENGKTFYPKYKNIKVQHRLDNIEKYKERDKQYYWDNREKIKQYRKNNKEYYKEHNKQYYINNKEYYYQKVKQWKGNNLERFKEYNKQYHLNNKEYFNKKSKQYNKQQRQIDPLFRFSHNIRTLLSASFRNKNIKKNTKTEQILGCTINEFINHLQSQFIYPMSLENHGLIWEIDHITPISSAKTEEDIITLNHYTNLRPLFKTTEIAEQCGYNIIGNRNKGNKII